MATGAYPVRGDLVAAKKPHITSSGQVNYIVCGAHGMWMWIKLWRGITHTVKGSEQGEIVLRSDYQVVYPEED